MANRREYEMLFSLNAQLGGGYNATFQKAQREIVSMQKEIDALNKTQSDIKAFEKQQGAVEATHKKLDALRQQYDNIQKEIQETEGFSSSLENKLIDKQRQIEKTSDALAAHTQKLEQTSGALQAAGVNTDNLGRASADLSAEIVSLKQRQEEAAEKATGFGSAASQAFGAIGQAVIAAGIGKTLKEIYEYFADCTVAAMEYEQALTGVTKTTDITDVELAVMSREIKALSTEIPITASELAAITENAGQLGIYKENLLDFTRVMADLGVATNLTGEDAAQTFAKFANITQMPQTDFARLGSTVVALGNNLATTERDIASMALNLASAAKQAGMSEADIIGLAGALSSVGMEAQAGGTAFSKTMNLITIAVETGNADLDEFAHVAGLSADEFAKAWRDNAATALVSFTEGLADTERHGASTVKLLDELGLTEIRLSDALRRAAGSGDLFRNSIVMGNQAWNENLALSKEAELFYGTTQNQLVMMQNAYNNLKVAVGDNFTPTLRELYGVGADVLGGVTEFVENNPVLVRSVTAAGGAFAAATGAVTGLSTAIKVFNALKAAGAFAAFTGPVWAGIAAVTALAGGIALLASAASEDAIPSVRELTSAAREMDATMREAGSAYEDIFASAQAAANVADIYIGKLEELEAAGLATDEQKKQYHNTLALLCQVVPELSGYINLETDTINGGTEALRSNTEALKQNAMQQGMQEYLTALYKQYADVLIEAEKNSIGLTNAQYSLEAANQKYSDSVAKMEKLWAEAQRQAETFNRETGSMTDATNWLTQEYYDLHNSLGELNSELWDSEQVVKVYTKAIKEGGEASAEAEAQIALAEEAIKSLTGATEEETEAARDAVRQQQELQSVISGVTAESLALVDAYSEAYDAALSSVGGQYDLWDRAAKVVETSATKINSGLESQIKYWQDYNANLAGLTDRASDIEGLAEMIASFADGSADSVNAVAGMSKASDKDLKKMVENWQSLKKEQETVADSLAQLETDFSASMAALQHELQTTVSEMDLTSEAAESGKRTVQSFIDGAEDMLPAVEAAYARLSLAATNALSGYNTLVSGSSTINAYYMQVHGSHAEGLDYVPFDGYIAELHKGERVLTAEENQYITLAPQLIVTLAAMNASANAAMTEYSGGAGVRPPDVVAYRQMDGTAMEVLPKPGGQGVNNYYAYYSQMINALPVDGVHAGGLNYVPFDGYTAELHKGEHVLTAEENQYITDAQYITEAQQITFAPQLMGALSAFNSDTNAVMAEHGGAASPIHITIAPEYHISGGEAPAQLEAILSANNENLRELVIGILEEDGIDVARRAYK